MIKKILIFDSSSLISLTMNGLIGKLEELKKIFNGKFIITEEVKYEVIDRPINIKRFELEALRVNYLLKNKILELPSSLGIKNSEISDLTKKILNSVNNIFETRKKNVDLRSGGEASCLALNEIVLKKGSKTAIVVDERTTRLLVENPENLKKLMQNRLHMKVKQKSPYPKFKDFEIIRSSELMYVAYRKNLFKLKHPKTLDAILYALKFKGCAISTDEIEEIKRMK